MATGAVVIVVNAIAIETLLASGTIPVVSAFNADGVDAKRVVRVPTPEIIVKAVRINTGLTAGTIGIVIIARVAVRIAGLASGAIPIGIAIRAIAGGGMGYEERILRWGLLDSWRRLRARRVWIGGYRGRGREA